jgi:molybdenum cofactor cytidylyltransferase
MRLTDALRIKRGDVVAFVGAGGKSSAIRILSNELSKRFPVLLSTTTKLRLDQADLAQKHLILSSHEDYELIFELLHSCDSLLLTKERDTVEPKWVGLELEEVRGLIRLVKSEGAVLLLEADGARGRSLKAPSDYEPVLPKECDLVVPVVGLDVVGEKLASPLVHRKELVSELLHLANGEPISSEHIVKIIRSEQGGLKRISRSAKVRVLLNKADTSPDLERGYEIALGLLAESRIRSVLLASVLRESPVHESIGRVAGVVLAAGRSSRMEGLKQLIPFRGKPMVMHSIDAALGAGLNPIVVVTGENDGMMEVVENLPILVLQNSRPEQGQSSSIRLGMEAICDQAEAVVFFLADMPLISPHLVEALVKRHRQTLASIIQPIAGGRRGNPVLFDQATFEDLQRLHGDQGGRALFDQYEIEHVEWDDSIHFDVDSEDDLSKLREFE